MRVLSVAVLLVLLNACSPTERHQDGEWRETFEGDVIAVNDQAVHSSFRMAFYSTDGDETPERYRIISGCYDAGYFDKNRQAFLSGASPKGLDADKMSDKDRRNMAQGHRRRCPSDHPVIFSQLLDVMYDGAVLTVDGKNGRLVSPNGGSISLIEVTMPFFVD